jgi:hypothetical protein
MAVEARLTQARAAPPNTGEESGAARPDDASALFGRLRWLSARAQSLRDLALELRAHAGAAAPAAVRDRDLRASVQEDAGFLERNCQEMTAVLGEISALLERTTRLYSAWGDVVARIQLAWERAVAELAQVGEEHVKDRTRRLARMIAALESIIYYCGLVTIPSRITSHLQLLPIGGALQFRDAYADELPTAELRHRFLRYLANYPGYVYGLIDVDGERILRASPKAWRRGLTLPLTAALALAGFGLVYLACYLGDVAHLSDWPFDGKRLGEHLTGYAYLLLGALAHVVINLLKQDRAASRSTEAVSDWILRIHVRETSYYVSALSLWLGSFAMAFLFKDHIDWKTAFFVGYSYDSFIDLFLQRFEKAVATSQAAIQKTVNPTARRGKDSRRRARPSPPEEE